MDHVYPHNVLLAIATNILVLLMTGFVLQGHVCYGSGADCKRVLCESTMNPCCFCTAYWTHTHCRRSTVKRAGRRDLLGVAVMPLSGGWVLLEQSGHPLLTLELALACRLPLSLLQEELLIGRLCLVLVTDGPSHMLPQPKDDTQTLFLISSIKYF